jgi:hypothetical protein
MHQSIENPMSRKFILAVVALLAAMFPSPAWAADQEWSLDKDKDGIEVYTRPVEGSGIKEFKGVADVDADIENILSLLRDSDRFKTWFPNTSESKLLFRDGDLSYQYSVMAPGKTNVMFTMHLEPGGGVPKWMINARIVATPFEALTNLRVIVAISEAN